MRRHRVLIVTLAACLGIVAGCSSSGSNSKPASGSSSGGPASKEPIVIGSIGEFSGQAASSTANNLKVLKAWADSVNKAGGLDGHPVHLITKDLGDNVAGGLAAVKELVEQDHVVALVHEIDSGDGTWASYVQSKGIPVIGGTIVSPTFATNSMFFLEGTDFA